MKCVLSVLVALALAGCGTKNGVIVDGVTPTMPEDIRQNCDPVPDAPPRGSNMGDLYQWSDSMLDQYAECALRDAKKRAWVEKQGM